MNEHFLEPLIKQYLSEKDITQGTYNLFKIILDQYISYLKTHQIDFPTTIDVIAFLEWKKSDGCSIRWTNHQIGTLKNFYRYLCLNLQRLSLPEVYAFDIMQTIQREILDHNEFKPTLSTEQAKQLLLYCKERRHTRSQYRDYAIVYLMLTTGVRSIEIRRAKRKDLKRVKRQLVLYIQGKGKTASDTYVKIPEGLEQAINDYLSLRKDNNPFLFIGHSRHQTTPYLSRSFVIKMFKQLMKDAGLEETQVTAHGLRHTAATMNLQRGGSLESTRQLLRHATVTTTMIYAHHVGQMKDEPENEIERLILDFHEIKTET
ncbi:tyrosine-type recombinase/integrase [Acholeplasma manati]|uniref:Tyrosine-type recombinase/integrase n=1 Tax=Paracholeplasma manati TaxID=591373 RepID=A0ABT2Y423_9MOLU|nr:tyrosine-type recombinase/integrase [Paracholeplasma manati]MCV2231487.1 tyrosine-type recombinase/integrase [Paracholeplasma manati]